MSLHHTTAIIARLAGTSLHALLSTDRHRPAIIARQVSMWMLRNVFGMTFVDTARYLQLRDHTTAVHACQTVDRELREGKGRRADLLFEVIRVLAREGTL